MQVLQIACIDKKHQVTIRRTVKWPNNIRAGVEFDFVVPAHCWYQHSIQIADVISLPGSLLAPMTISGASL